MGYLRTYKKFSRRRGEKNLVLLGILLVAILLLGNCTPFSKPIAPAPPVPDWEKAVEDYFVPGEGAFEKAQNCIDLDPRGAKDYYLEAIVNFRHFLSMTRGEPEAKSYIERANRKIETANKNIAFIDARIQDSLNHYRNGLRYYNDGISLYNQWRYTKELAKGKEALKKLKQAINTFENVEVLYTPEEYDEVQAKIQDSRRKIQEITTWRPPPPENEAPIANAGSSRRVHVNTLVTLNGSRSYDPDGDRLTYRWTQTKGPPVTLSNPTDVKPTFTPKEAGTYTFCLVVNDGKLNSAPAYVTITVRSVVDLGTFTHNGYVGTNVEISSAKKGILSRGQCRRYRAHIKRHGHFEVCVPAGYKARGDIGSDPRDWVGIKTFPQYFYQFLCYGREVEEGTDITVKVCREENSPDDFVFIFHLYPPGRTERK